MKGLVEFIKTVNESNKGDKLPVEVYNYLQELKKNCSDKETSNWAGELLATCFFDGEFEERNISGKLSDKIQINIKELYKWVEEFVKEYNGIFVIANPKHDLLICIMAEINTAVLHYKNLNIYWDENFFDDVKIDMDIDVYDRGKHWQDPSAIINSYTTKMTKSEVSKDDYSDELLDDWIENVSSNIVYNDNDNFLQLAKNMCETLFDEKFYNKFKSVIQDKHTFVYFQNVD